MLVFYSIHNITYGGVVATQRHGIGCVPGRSLTVGRQQPPARRCGALLPSCPPHRSAPAAARVRGPSWPAPQDPKPVPDPPGLQKLVEGLAAARDWLERAQPFLDEGRSCELKALESFAGEANRLLGGWAGGRVETCKRSPCWWLCIVLASAFAAFQGPPPIPLPESSIPGCPPLPLAMGMDWPPPCSSLPGPDLCAPPP